LEGLRKMPTYSGSDLFRGERITPQQFGGRKYKKGGAYSYDSFASFSKQLVPAFDFMLGKGTGVVPDPAKSVGVLTVLTDSGGRDISEISLAKREAEVCILAGSTYEVVSVEDVTSDYAETSGPSAPTTFYVVRLKGPPRFGQNDVRVPPKKDVPVAGKKQKPLPVPPKKLAPTPGTASPPSQTNVPLPLAARPRVSPGPNGLDELDDRTGLLKKKAARVPRNALPAAQIYTPRPPAPQAPASPGLNLTIGSDRRLVILEERLLELDDRLSGLD
jgi:hypothetical protein